MNDSILFLPFHEDWGHCHSHSPQNIYLYGVFLWYHFLNSLQFSFFTVYSKFNSLAPLNISKIQIFTSSVSIYKQSRETMTRRQILPIIFIFLDSQSMLAYYLTISFSYTLSKSKFTHRCKQLWSSCCDSVG